MSKKNIQPTILNPKDSWILQFFINKFFFIFKNDYTPPPSILIL